MYCRKSLIALAAILLSAAAAAGPPTGAAAAAQDEPAAYLKFVEEFTGQCVARSGVQVQIQNTHPTRTIRVWLDRYHAGSGTGDRSRSDLAPGTPAEPLGCSRNQNLPQEWRVVRAAFVD